MVYGAPELERQPVLEHGTSRTSRWLRAYRTRIALWIAVVEGVFVVFGLVPRLPVLALALALIALHFAVGRTLRPPVLRQLSWIAAASQAFVALIPLLLILLGTLALIALGAIALVALVLLFGDRR